MATVLHPASSELLERDCRLLQRIRTPAMRPIPRVFRRFQWRRAFDRCRHFRYAGLWSPSRLCAVMQHVPFSNDNVHSIRPAVALSSSSTADSLHHSLMFSIGGLVIRRVTYRRAASAHQRIYTSRVNIYASVNQLHYMSIFIINGSHSITCGTMHLYEVVYQALREHPTVIYFSHKRRLKSHQSYMGIRSIFLLQQYFLIRLANVPCNQRHSGVFPR